MAYFAVTFIITNGIKKLTNSKLEYLLANRQVPVWAAALSFASTWIWAPALFVAAQQAYVNGWVGVFWFTVPNVATLVIFAYFASWMRQKYPEGFTFSGYIREKTSKRVHNLYMVESFGLQTLSLAVQLLAGAAILYKITGIPFVLTTVLLALIPLVYTIGRGLKASIITDFWQMTWIVLVLLLGIPFMLINGGGTEVMIEGLRSHTGDIHGLFSGRGLAVTLAFGIPTTIGLLSGTFGDQMFWQRVFAVKEKSVKKSLLWSAVMFAIVPLSLAVFGFMAAGSGLKVTDLQLTNAEAVIAFAPRWFMYIFLVMILSGLISTVDSIICAVSSVTGHDVWERTTLMKAIFGTEVRLAKISMAVVVFVAVIIANTGVQILHLFLIYGTLRASVMLPSAFAIKDVKMSERGMFYGILAALVIGLPIFTIGNFTGNTLLIVSGSLLTILLSGVISITLKDQK